MSSVQTQPPVEPFVSATPWDNAEPDCLVVSCSDHRFEQPIRDLARHLNFNRPHVLQIPSGAALTLPLLSSINFLSKATDRLIERIVEMKQVRDIIIVAHHDCGAYKPSKSPLLNSLVQRYTGKTIHDVQRDHLVQAARRLRLGIRGARVRAFFADVVNEQNEPRVRFIEETVR